MLALGTIPLPITDAPTPPTVFYVSYISSCRSIVMRRLTLVVTGFAVFVELKAAALKDAYVALSTLMAPTIPA